MGKNNIAIVGIISILIIAIFSISLLYLKDIEHLKSYNICVQNKQVICEKILNLGN